MSSTVKRSSRSGGGGSSRQSQSLFFRDIASPISAHRGKFVTPSQAAAVSALWSENFSASDLPPPPVFTLEDRVEFSPEELPSSPRSESRTPPSPAVGGATPGGEKQQQQQLSPGSGSWWSPVRGGGGGGDGGEEKGSPVDGVVQSGALVMLPPPREVARPEMMRRESVLATGGLDEEEWVTVYGFSPGDTNLVLREFEKCGMILKHIPGPRDANWMHILYQNRYDAKKAIAKNGLQMNNVLIVGVKPVDPAQRQFLNEKINSNHQGGFMVSFPPPSANGRSTAAPTSSKPSPRPYHLQSTTGSISESGRHSDGAIATPAKSVFSKAMDLMFGL